MAVLMRVIKAPTGAMRKMYDWTIRWSNTKKAPQALFAIAFVESSFFPVPPDVLLIAMVVGKRKSWFRNALICTIGSVAGALLGYVIGMALWESVGKPIVDFYKLQGSVDIVREAYRNNAFLAILTAAFTPIPYKVFTISAGLFAIPVPVLVIASAIGRAGRFFAVAGLLRIFGDRIASSIERNFDLFSIVFMVLLIGGFLAIRYLH